MAAAAASRPPPWLHRLHVKKRISSSSNLQIDDLLYGQHQRFPPPPPSSNSKKPSPPAKDKQPNLKQQQQPPQGNNPSLPNPSNSNPPPLQPQVSTVIADLFVTTSTPLANPPIKAHRKQNHPRRIPNKSSHHSIENKDNAMVEKCHCTEHNMNVDNERYTRNNVTIIDTDTDTDGWKTSKLPLHKDIITKVHDNMALLGVSEHVDPTNGLLPQGTNLSLANPSSSNPPPLQLQLSTINTDLFINVSSTPLDNPPISALHKQNHLHPRPNKSSCPSKENKCKGKAKVKKRRRTEHTMNTDKLRSTQNKVTIMDTSTNGWKATKLLLRKGTIWKVHDNKALGVSKHVDPTNELLPNLSSGNLPPLQLQLPTVIVALCVPASYTPLANTPIKAIHKQNHHHPRLDMSSCPNKENKDKAKVKANVKAKVMGNVKAKIKKHRHTGNTMNANKDKCTRNEVTIIDTSTSGWKAAKLLFHSGAIWKVRDNKALGVSKHVDPTKVKRWVGLVSKIRRDREKEKESTSSVSTLHAL
ncbi:hypothetical protein ABZP36_010278 [Zizania latifolia]